jgi:hypothetical protein
MITQAAPAVIPAARPTLPQLVGLGVVLVCLLVVAVGTADWWAGWVREATVPPDRAHYPYNDFAEEMAATGLLVSPQRVRLYDLDVQTARQQTIWGPRLPAAVLPFVRVPWTTFLLLPLLALPYGVAFLVFSACSVVLAGAGFVAWARWIHAPPLVGATFVLAGLASFPLLRTLQLGQYSAITFAAVTAALLWLWRGQQTRAGLVLLGATVKPHLIVLLPLGLLAERRWRAIVAGGAGLLALTLLSLLTFGPTWPGDYLTILRGDLGALEGVEQMQNWRGLFESTLGLRGPLLTALMTLALAATAALVAWVWWPVWTAKQPAAVRPPSAIRNPHSTDLRWAVTIIASLLFSPHYHFNDMLLWAIPAAIILRRLYAPPPGGAFGPRARTVAFILLWLAYVLPVLAFFAQAARPGLWFALLALALLIARIRRETATSGAWRVTSG